MEHLCIQGEMGRQLQLVRAVVGTLGCSKGRTSFLRSGLTRHSAKQVLETRLGHGAFPARAWVESLVRERRLGKVHSAGKEGRKEGRGERWRREQMRRHCQQVEGRDPPALSPSPSTTCAHPMITRGTTARYRGPSYLQINTQFLSDGPLRENSR